MIKVNLLYDCQYFGWERCQVRESRVVNGARSRRKRMIIARALGVVAMVLWMVSLTVLAVPAAPALVTRLGPEVVTRVERVLGTSTQVKRSGFGDELYVEPEMILPEVDLSLPEENRIAIEAVGLDAPIGEGDDWEEVLRDGPWRVGDFGTPEERDRPMIVASHRFGYLAWTNQFRRERSFYNLPKVEVGTKVEVIWNQRKYRYEIYDGYTDEVIRPESYEADLILYTCEMLNTDKRIIRLGRLISQ